MTTVVMDRSGIAFDGLTSYGDRAEYTVFPKVVISNSTVFATAGDTSALSYIIKEVAENGKSPLEVGVEIRNIDDGQNWTLLTMNRRQYLEGVLTAYSSVALWGTLMALPFAIGSGADFAIGALGAGASPEGACKIAAVHDIGTGLHITFKPFPEIFRLMKDVPENTLTDVHGRPLPGCG